MTLERLVHAAALVGGSVSVDALGRGIVVRIDSFTKLAEIAHGWTIEEALSLAGERFAQWLRIARPLRWEQALRVLAGDGC